MTQKTRAELAEAILNVEGNVNTIMSQVVEPGFPASLGIEIKESMEKKEFSTKLNSVIDKFSIEDLVFMDEFSRNTDLIRFDKLREQVHGEADNATIEWKDEIDKRVMKRNLSTFIETLRQKGLSKEDITKVEIKALEMIEGNLLGLGEETLTIPFGKEDPLAIESPCDSPNCPVHGNKVQDKDPEVFG